MPLELKQFTKFMAGEGLTNLHGKIEIGDLNNENAVCRNVVDFRDHYYYAGVGTFINNRALICGGHHRQSSQYSNKCFSWNPEV